MSKLFSRAAKPIPRRRASSPGHLLEWAAVLVVLFFIAQMSGWRDFTSILNGTTGSTAMDWRESAFLGVLYMILYLGFVVVVPILILASVLLKLWQRMTATKGIDESRTNSETN